MCLLLLYQLKNEMNFAAFLTELSVIPLLAKKFNETLCCSSFFFLNLSITPLPAEELYELYSAFHN